MVFIVALAAEHDLFIRVLTSHQVLVPTYERPPKIALRFFIGSVLIVDLCSVAKVSHSAPELLEPIL